MPSISRSGLARLSTSMLVAVAWAAGCGDDSAVGGAPAQGGAGGTAGESPDGGGGAGLGGGGASLGGGGASLGGGGASLGGGGAGGEAGFSLTLHFRAIDGGASTLSSAPEGADCTGPVCDVTSTFAPGTIVTLTVEQPSTGVVKWSNGCAGESCVVTLDASTTIDVTASTANVVFVTNGTHDGDFGGLSGADAFCQAEADAANLPGTYVAFLGTSTASPFERLTGARGWIRPDGLPFMDDFDGFVTGYNGEMFYPATLTATGDSIESQTHTGSYGPETCTDWTTANGADRTGYSTVAEGQYWWVGFGVGCSQLLPITCFGTDLDGPVTPAVTAGRVAFVTNASFPTDAGIAAADALCQSEAQSAGLANADQFLAAMALSTGSAASRFDETGAPWVRPNGLLLAETAQDFLEGNVLAPVYSTADGTPIAIGVRIGADSLVADASDNCEDWSTSSASVQHDMAESSVAGSSPFYYATYECSVSFWNVLCLEP